MAGKEIGDRVLMIDYDGYFTGVTMAEKMADEGRQVSIVTQFGAVAPFLKHQTFNACSMKKASKNIPFTGSKASRSTTRSMSPRLCLSGRLPHRNATHHGKITAHAKYRGNRADIRHGHSLHLAKIKWRALF